MNERNVGGDSQKYGCVLDEIKAANGYFLSKLEIFSGKSNSNYDGEVVIANYYSVLNNVIDQQEELETCLSGQIYHHYDTYLIFQLALILQLCVN